MPEFETLKTKLKDYQFSDTILNKIKNPFEYGSGEKLKIFFDNLGFKINNSSIENKALKARNKLAHSSISKIDEETAKEFIRYKGVYLILYHRIILKILGIKCKYIDFYTNNFPERDIDDNIPLH